MPKTNSSNAGLTGKDDRLFEEALRRARASRFNGALDSAAIERAIIAELIRGTRDMHGLARAVAQLSLQK